VSRRKLASMAACAAALGLAVGLAAQGRGGGGGGFSGGGGGGFQLPTRLAMLTSAFKLEKEQAQTVKTIMDEAAKDAAVAAVRGELTAAHAAIGAAIEQGGQPEAVDTAVKAYAAVSQKMANLELAALAKVVKSLNEPQRSNANAMSSAVSMMRGAFLDKKWDVTPGGNSY